LNITKILFIIAIFAITSNAEFIVQSTFTNNNCDTSSGYIGNAVIQNKSNFKKHELGRCLLFGPSHQVLTKQNSTHFNLHMGCDKECKICRNTQSLAYQCIRFPGSPISIQYGLGKVPEIKKYGFILNIHNSNTCNAHSGITSFVTDRFCFSQTSNIFGFATKIKKGSSSMTQYNHELKQAEMIAFDAEGCTGNVIKKEVYPLGKCLAGPGGSMWVSVEKP
jgi:hypothetical protein